MLGPGPRDRQHVGWVVLCDFDGTITLEDVTDSLLLLHGDAGWRALEHEWREGRIGSRECMEGQVRLLDCSRQQLDDYVSGVAIDPDFPRFVAEAQDLGMTVEVVSDGLDHVVRSVLSRHGLARLPVISNRLRASGPRRWRLDFPHAGAACRASSGTCKCARIEPRTAQGDASVLLVGDGASDYCAASRASVVFAKDALATHCGNQGIVHRPIAGFGDAIEYLAELSPVTKHAQRIATL